MPASTPSDATRIPYATEVLPTQKAPFRVVLWMAVAQGGIFLALLAPVTVTLALKVQQIVPKADAASALGTVLTIAALMALVANPVVGRLSDMTTSRWGRRRPWMLAGCGALIIGMIVIATAGSIPVVLVGWLLGQLGGNMVLAPLLTTIADQVPDFQRGTVSGNVGIAQNVGILAAAYAGAVLGDDILWLFLAPALVGTATVIVFCAVLPDKQVRIHKHPHALLETLQTFWVNPVKHPDFGWAWWSRFFMILSAFLFITFRLFYIQDRLKLPADHATSVLASGVLIYTITLVVFAKFAGWLSDRLGRRKVFVIVAAVIFAVATYLLAHVSTVGGYYAIEAIIGIGYGVYFAVDMALVVDVLPNPDDAAKDLGVMNIANALPQSLAGGIGAFFLGLGTAAGDNYDALLIAAAVCGLIGAATIFPVKSVR